LAAGLAIDDHKTVQDISYAKLRQRLLATGQKLVWTPPPKPQTAPSEANAVSQSPTRHGRPGN